MKSPSIHEITTCLRAQEEAILNFTEAPSKKRVFGLRKHHYPVGIPEDFDAPSADIEELFLNSNSCNPDALD